MSTPLPDTVLNLLAACSSGEQTILGGGVIRRCLSQKDHSIVFETLTNEYNQKRVVKVLFANLSTAGQYCKIVNECFLHHTAPQLVTMYAVWHRENCIFLESEKIEGASLDQVLQKRGAFPVDVSLAIAMELLKGILFLDTIKHDNSSTLSKLLTPSNIIIGQDGSVKITDFGVCSPYPLRSDPQLSVPMASFHLYAPPEYFESTLHGVASDLFSWGAIFFLLLTGEAPYCVKAKNHTEIPKRKLKHLSLFDSHVPSKVKKIIVNALNPVLNKRDIDLKKIQGILLEEFRKFSPDREPDEMIEFFLNTPEEFNGKPLKKSGVLVPLIIVSLSVAALYGVLFNSDNEKSIYADNTQTKNQDAYQALFDSEIEPDTEFEAFKEEIPDTEHYYYETEENTENSRNAGPRDTKKSGKKVSRVKNVPSPKKKQSLPKQFQSKTLDTIVDDPWEPNLPSFVIPEYENTPLQKVFVAEIKKRNYTRALEVYPFLSQDDKNSEMIQIYLMRALIGTKKGSEIELFFRNTTIKDKEYYLQRAKFEFERNLYDLALESLTRAHHYSASIADEKYLDKQITIYKARVTTAKYSEIPSKINQQIALDAWFSVKYLLRFEQSSPAYKEAEKSIRDITIEDRNNQ